MYRLKQNKGSLVETVPRKVTPPKAWHGLWGCLPLDDKVTMVEFEKASVYALNILAQREFKSLFSKSTTEERKILCLMAESDETILSYSYIKENANLNSEPSALLKNLVNKKI